LADGLGEPGPRRSIHAAWERGDFSSVEWAHPEIEYVWSDGPSPGSQTGVAGMIKVFRDWMSTWADFRVEPEEYRELDGERVLVLARFSGRGKMSGLEVGKMRQQGAMLFYIRDGEVTRFFNYWDRDRAFADLGLKE
jgi:ketosteroid isomerase-like protein